MLLVQELCANGFETEARRTCERKGQTRFESRKFCPICGNHRTSELTNNTCSMGVEKEGKNIKFHYKDIV
jgi:hypothetical protein